MIREFLAAIGKIIHQGKTIELYAKAYEDIAPHYDQCATRQSLANETAEVINTLALKPGMRCLDLGCGTGHATKLIEGKIHNGKILACDISPAMLAIAKEKTNPNITTFIVKDMLSMLKEQPDNSLDLISSFWAMDYNSDIAQTLVEIRRTLISGGQTAILVNTQESLPEIQRIVTKVFLKNIFVLRTLPPVWVPKSINKFKKMVDDAGLFALDLSAHSIVYNFTSGKQLVEWIKTGGPCAGFKYFLKKQYEEYVFAKIQEEADKAGILSVTFKFIRFVGGKK